MSQPEPLKIRPYARLLTMLGDQLIKNERIALMELIKNSYDADADWSRVLFEEFGDNLKHTDKSLVIIEDNGLGMTKDVIKKAWMNPATPNKRRENSSERRSPEKQRIIQGEKGIGRFSALKLGKCIRIITRPKGSKNEYVVEFDFSAYDAEFTKHHGKNKELFLDHLHADLTERTPQVFVKRKIRINGRRVTAPEHGTRIEITNLKGRWTPKKIEDLCKDTLKLQSVFSQLFTGHDERPEMKFEVSIVVCNEEKIYHQDIVDRLKGLIETSAVLKIEDGYFDNDKLEFRFLINSTEKTIPFDELRSDRWCKERFKRAAGEDKRVPVCGNFRFSFYVFDLKADVGTKYNLSNEDIETIKPHRVYLYRDGIRVYPYGDPEDDWLGIDIARGTVSAGAFLSNDQVIGCIDITHEGNPDLRDKTSREGLVDEGDATEDFLAVIKTFLSYVRKQPFTEYRQIVEKRRLQKALEEGRTTQVFAELLSHLEKTDDAKACKIAKNVERAYKTEKQVLEQRVKTTEDLAAVGIAVETSSHDLMLMMGRALEEIDLLTNAAMVEDDPIHEHFDDLQRVRGMLSFIEQRMNDVQSLFKSSKQRRRSIRVREILDKVAHIYRHSFQKEGIDVDIQEVGPPLIAKCTDAVLMQLFINLFDNSLYWMRDVSPKKRNVVIKLDGDEGNLIFADSGPGVIQDLTPYIFDPFVSGKGDDGRGLGLYIAKQLLERMDYSIELAETKKDRILGGACFVVSFVPEDSE